MINLSKEQITAMMTFVRLNDEQDLTAVIKVKDLMQHYEERPQGDFISRETLKKAFEKVYPLSTNEMGGVVNKQIYEIIDNTPTVPLPDFKEGYKQAILDGKTNFSRPQSEWIPVSERLPEQGNQSYLVTVKYGDITCSCQRFFFSDDIGWNDDCVVAWQPLPEPYKKGGAE